MKIEIFKNNIVHFSFDTQKEIVLTFYRIQEFYESKHKVIRNKVFDTETFMENYMDESGKMTYFHYYDGFNMPGNVFLKFHKRYKGNITRREQWMFDEVKKRVDMKKKFYIIASVKSDKCVLNHELAHAMYYVFPGYKREMNAIIDTMPKSLYKKLCKHLSEMEYTKEVFDDEIQAYLGTEADTFGLDKKLVVKYITQMYEVVLKYMEQLKQ